MIRHKHCYHYSLDYIKDTGAYDDIINKYLFLNSQLQH